jgi:hypothetical protein
MRLSIGYELSFCFAQPTPVVMLLTVHHSRVSDLEKPDTIVTQPIVPVCGFLDCYGFRTRGRDAHRNRYGGV